MKKKKVKPGVHVMRRAKHSGWWVFYRSEWIGQPAYDGGFHTQKDARAFGRQLAIRERCELLIHRRSDGKIRAKDSFGNDPKGRG